MILHNRTLWLTVSWLWLFVIIILSLITLPQSVEVAIPHIDKIEHAMSYFILMVLFGQCYTQKRTRLIYAVVFICMGIILEYLQNLTATRQFEYADMLANSSGVVLGVVLSESYLGNVIVFIDNKLK